MKHTLRRRFVTAAAAALVAAVSGLISPAGAQTFSSSYSSTAERDCRTVGKSRDGGATQLCIFCDITVVAENAKVGWPSIPVGGGLISPMWSFLVGPKRAKQM